MISAGESRFGVDAWAEADPDRLALVDGDRRWSYDDLRTGSTALARRLRAAGIVDGDRVAVMLGNSVEFFAVWAAVGRCAASPVLVNWHLAPDELAHILVDAGAKVLVVDASLWPGVASVVTPLDCVALVLDEDEDWGGEDGGGAEGIGGSDGLVRLETLPSPVFYTSGTTGRPKGVVHGRVDGEAARHVAQGQVALWSWTSEDVYLVSGPAYHAGPGGFAMSALYVGATVVVLPGWDARQWCALVDRFGVTITFMVPAHFIRILEVPEHERTAYDCSSLRLVVHGGAPCPVPIKEQIIDALAPAEVWELYGMSEGGATRISPGEWLEHRGSVGLPWPGVEVRILDDAGRPTPTGVDGLVYVRPAGGARFHYHDDPGKTDAAWADDAFTVGDVGHLDDDGYLYLTDRATDMIIRGGVNIYPREIENVLFTHPAVIDCAVFGVPDDRLGERVRAVVELRTPVEITELQRHVAVHLASYKVPAEIVATDELPRHPNGKVLKRRLRDEAWSGRDSRIG